MDVPLERNIIRKKVVHPIQNICVRARMKLGCLCHVGTHRFVCGICGRGTNSESNMNAHMRQHSGAYECHICGGERFKSWQDLEQHKEEIHGVTSIVRSLEKRGSLLKGQSLRECKSANCSEHWSGWMVKRAKKLQSRGAVNHEFFKKVFGPPRNYF